MRVAQRSGARYPEIQRCRRAMMASFIFCESVQHRGMAAQKFVSVAAHQDALAQEGSHRIRARRMPP